MTMLRIRSVLFLFMMQALLVSAQNKTTYQTPPKDIASLLLAKPTPSVSIDQKGEWMVIIERNTYTTVEELGQPEFKIAGLRLNPNNFSPSRQSFINNLTLKNLKENKTYLISGLPTNLAAANINWSPNDKKFAFTQTGKSRTDLYIVDIKTRTAKKVNGKALNTVIGNNLVWLDDNTIIYKAATHSPTALPQRKITPLGPTIQENIGKVAPSATFEDLIKSPYDEEVFEFLASSQLILNKSGVETLIGKPGIYISIDPSPDKQYILTRVLHKPFSYLVTAYGFPSTVSITDRTGKLVKELAGLPSSEGTPSGYDNTLNAPRAFEWRSDEPATVCWTEPLDSGLIRKKVPYHDALYALPAPFTGTASVLFKTKLRFAGITWGDASLALVTEMSRSKQLVRLSRYSNGADSLETLFERSQNDAYHFPGNPVLKKNKYNREVIVTTDNGSKVLLNNTTGSSPKGDLPFLAKFDLSAKTNSIIWRCSEGSFEYVTSVNDPASLTIITRKESKTLVPNFYIRHLASDTTGIAITAFKNPYPQLDGVSKQKIFYKRADGVDLTGDLYLPAGYNKDKDGPLPVFIWAYPREFNSSADAAQVRGSENRFTTINWGSPVYFVTQGFAILDNAEMPIVAKDGKKPNDTFVEQLQLNAEAAINKLSEMGVGDRNRIAVGGHSYGAFMTANLLAHTHLFKAGIARSGAYNRTLTPFGFQNEDRTYWQDPKLYYDMSPFSFADKIKTPILLIHGDADDNPGTFPINSERLFNAIKGHGGTVRFVFLPYEAHHYDAKENLLHMLWEENEWLTKYVKNAK